MLMSTLKVVFGLYERKATGTMTWKTFSLGKMTKCESDGPDSEG